ncbi:zinc finger MIZ domain-containing protein 1-like isoform X2 [Liolophura sinensis]|uniref:zinc finger MIZ domain-containing protein 1-like isoform X2 n=1 Tax=Liolophura sinensis TaxID=3198878 RepID=UPI003158FBE0
MTGSRGPPVTMNDMDRHIQQTNDRLQCIKQALLLSGSDCPGICTDKHLSTPQGFQNAARELLEWCSDQRAFQRPFENGLMGCLTVVSQVSTKPGYDLDLGYRLLAVCAAHREKFSPKSAAMLSMWCEELGRLLLLRHQKNRNPDSSKSPPGMHPQLQKGMPPGPVPPNDANSAWNVGNQSLSVVTTVWGVTQTTQSGPVTHSTPGYTNTTMSTTPYTQQPMGFPGNGMQKGPYGNPPNMPYRREPGAYGRPGYPPTPNTPGSSPAVSGSNDYQAPPGALSAAAFVAAAATATATATATASMVLQEQQNQQQMNMNMNMNLNGQYGHQMPHGQQFGNQYGMPGQRHPGPMGPGPGPMPSKPGLGNMYGGQRRPGPYPSHHQIQQKRHFPNGAPYLQPGYGQAQQQFPGKGQYPPSQQPLPSPTYGAHPQQLRPNGPAPPYNNGPNQYMVPGPYSTRPQQPQHPQHPQHPPGFPQMATQQNFPPYSPIPGNPTPPMTPGTTMPPYVSPGQPDVKGNFPDIKPTFPIKKENEELRLTFPVRDGVVLPPFRLEHNLAVSNHVFHLRESVYQTLMWRSDLELQLKCFHHEDRQMNTNWPASVTVSVNAKPLDIERGENKTSHKPLYLKEVCQPGRNTIQITVTACCCSHLFVLQLVHRPSVRSVLQGLLRKRLLPADHCITKIKRNFTNVAASNNQLNQEDGVEQTAIKVSLKCPITFRRITLPARGHDCKHIQCFDLESYLQLNCERGSWRCPVCNKAALLEGLEIDQYIWSILTNLGNTEFEEVTIDNTASWKPVQLKNSIKDEEADPCGMNARWMKPMSPSSMTMPTSSSWDMGHQPSPYNMPQPAGSGPGFGGSFGGGPPPISPGCYPPGGMDFSGPLSHMGDNMHPQEMMHQSDKQFNKGVIHRQFAPQPSPGDHHLQHPSEPHLNMTGQIPVSNQSQPLSHNNGSHPLSHHPAPNHTAHNTSDAQTPNPESNPANDLNFDPAAIIDGETSTPGLDLLPENIGDPMELLSYLGPPDSSGDVSGGGTNGTAANGNSASNSDDLLALFEP